MNVRIQNMRKHEVFVADGVDTIPPLGSIEIEEGLWKKIYSEDKHKRLAVSKKHLVIDRVAQASTIPRKKKEAV